MFWREGGRAWSRGSRRHHPDFQREVKSLFTSGSNSVGLECGGGQSRKQVVTTGKPGLGDAIQRAGRPRAGSQLYNRKNAEGKVSAVEAGRRKSVWRSEKKTALHNGQKRTCNGNLKYGKSNLLLIGEGSSSRIR